MNEVNVDVLAILKALTDKVESLEQVIYAKDNLLVKAGLVVSNSPTPAMDNSLGGSNTYGDVGDMNWSEIHKKVKDMGGQ